MTSMVTRDSTSVGPVSTYFDTNLVLVLAILNFFFDTSLVLILSSILILGWYMASITYNKRRLVPTMKPPLKPDGQSTSSPFLL